MAWPTNSSSPNYIEVNVAKVRHDAFCPKGHRDTLVVLPVLHPVRSSHQKLTSGIVLGGAGSP